MVNDSTPFFNPENSFPLISEPNDNVNLLSETEIDLFLSSYEETEADEPEAFAINNILSFAQAIDTCKLSGRVPEIYLKN